MQTGQAICKNAHGELGNGVRGKRKLKDENARNGMEMQIQGIRVEMQEIWVEMGKMWAIRVRMQ